MQQTQEAGLQHAMGGVAFSTLLQPYIRQWYAECGGLVTMLMGKAFGTYRTQDLLQQELHWSDVQCVLVSFVFLDVYMAA